MRKSHVVVLALLIAVGSMLGTYALTRTTELGVQAQKTSSESVDAVVAARSRQLNALEASLRKALVKKPPPLPALPKIKAQPSQPAPRVYTPAPVVVTRAAAPAPTVSRARPVSQTRRAPSHESDHTRASSGGEQDD
jgi:hypothetical protein